MSLSGGTKMKRYEEFVKVMESQLHEAMEQKGILVECAQLFTDTVKNEGVIDVFFLDVDIHKCLGKNYVLEQVDSSQ